MPSFGKKSKERLEHLHPDMVKVMESAIKEQDFSILDTHRDAETQDKYFREGKSQVMWPNSKHNAYPSLAVDICPWPEQFKASEDRWIDLANCINKHADALGIPVRWGGDWLWKDYPHFELVEGSDGD